MGGETKKAITHSRGVSSAFLMRDVIAAANRMDGITEANIKKGFEPARDQVPAGLIGVCRPSTWSSDRRGTTTVMLYRNRYTYGNTVARMSCQTTIPLRPMGLAGRDDKSKTSHRAGLPESLPAADEGVKRP